MKSIKIFAVLLALLAYGSGQAQSADDYAVLSTFLPAEKLDSIQETEIGYAQYAYLNRHGYHLSSFGEKDVPAYPMISEVSALYPGLPTITIELIENGELNLMGYNFVIKQDFYSYYKISGSDKVLVILPISLTEKKRLSESE